MTIPSVPRTALTKRLEPAKRQFFVWFYLEKRKIKWIKQEMDRLSLALRDITGNNFEAAEKTWRGRQRSWNNREWNIRGRNRGPHIAVPVKLLELPLWRRNDEDVGNWRMTPYVSNRPRNTIPTLNNAPSMPDQREVGCWGGYEISASGRSDNDETSQTTRNLSISSWGTQNSSIGYTSEHPSESHPPFSPIESIPWTTPTHDTFTHIHPPLLPSTEPPFIENGESMSQRTTVDSTQVIPTFHQPRGNEIVQSNYMQNCWTDCWGFNSTPCRNPSYGPRRG